MNLFQHEDAILLGMLFSNSVRPYVRGYGTYIRYGYGTGQYNSSMNGKMYPVLGSSISTGRGGWFYSQEGDAGRTPKLDERFGNCALCGRGGKLFIGGGGLKNGKLGFGGQKDPNSQITRLSAGGGGGFYGGGSSFAMGGGGGGSSCCPAASYNASNTRRDPKEYDLLNEPLELYKGKREPGVLPPIKWDDSRVYDVSADGGYISAPGFNKETVIEELEGLIELNSNNESFYVARHEDEMGTYYSWDEYKDIFAKAHGNGFIIISKPNQHIRFKKLGSGAVNDLTEKILAHGGFIGDVGKLVNKILKYGKLEGVGDIIYPPDDWEPGQKLKATDILFTPGVYEVILYGAAGGSVGPWSETTRYMVGGEGGCQICVLDIAFPVRLFAVLGQRGSTAVGIPSSNGGGAADEYTTSGGGATDLRWRRPSEQDSLLSRVAIAGGGGGIYVGAFSDSGHTGVQSDVPNGFIGTGYTPLFTDRYIVNHYTKVKVEFDVDKSLDEGPVSYDIELNLDDGNEGTLKKTITINEAGHQEIYFDLNDVYLENTPTHEITIDAKIHRDDPAEEETEAPVLMITSQIAVSVETGRIDGESSVYEKKPLIIRGFDELDVSDYRAVLEYSNRNLIIEGSDLLETDDTGLAELGDKGHSGVLELSDYIDINDKAYTQIGYVQDNNPKCSDKIDLTDNVDIGMTSGYAYKVEAFDNLGLTNNIDIGMNSGYAYKVEAFDNLGLVDNSDYSYMYCITITIPKEYAFGKVEGAGLYASGTVVTLEAIPRDGCTVEWWKDGAIISTENNLVVTVTGSLFYEVRFIKSGSGADVPYVEQNLIGSFDALANKGLDVPQDIDSPIWFNLLSKKPVFVTDYRGLIDDGIKESIDGIDNRGIDKPHSLDSILWINLNSNQPNIPVTNRGLVSTNNQGSYDGIDNTSAGHSSSSKDWIDTKG